MSTPTTATPFAWYEKIALLLLAAWLEVEEGRSVRLSVPPRSARLLEAEGVDWARAVVAAIEHGRPFGSTDRPAQRAAYEHADPTASERVVLARNLPRLLEGLMAADRDYRYDGIWHDNGGNIDLVAWHPSRPTLLVEGKGVTEAGGGVAWSTARRDTADVLFRRVGWAEAPGADHGVLVPDDEALRGGADGFTSVLRAAWSGLPALGITDVFTVSADGSLRRRRPAVDSAGGNRDGSA